MKKILVLLLAGILVFPAVSFVQDSLQSSVSRSSNDSMESEESRADSKLEAEMAGQEASGERGMDIMDESMAGNSTSQMTAVEQADSQ
jgi:hypothetical protein